MLQNFQRFFFFIQLFRKNHRWNSDERCVFFFLLVCTCCKQVRACFYMHRPVGGFKENWYATVRARSSIDFYFKVPDVS